MPIKLHKKIEETTERSAQGITIPNGRYLVKVAMCEERTPQKGGDNYVNLEFEIMDTQRDAQAEAIGFKIFDKLSLTEAAQWRQVNLLDAIYPPKFVGDAIPDNIIDRLLVVDAREEEYEGVKRVRCRTFTAAAGWKGLECTVDKDGNLVYKNKESEKSAASSAKPGSDQVIM